MEPMGCVLCIKKLLNHYVINNLRIFTFLHKISVLIKSCGNKLNHFWEGYNKIAISNFILFSWHMIIIINLMKLFKHKFKTNKDDSKVCMLIYIKTFVRCSITTRKNREIRNFMWYTNKNFNLIVVVCNYCTYNGLFVYIFFKLKIYDIPLVQSFVGD